MGIGFKIMVCVDMGNDIDWLLWLSTMVPLVFSAGPGNIMVAVSGARSGLLQPLVFVYGLDFTYLLMAIAIGVGVGQVL
jgi:hypothetical protein